MCCSLTKAERCGRQGARAWQHLQFIIYIELESKTQAAQICGLFSSRHESHDKCIIAGESRSWSELWMFTSRFCFSPSCSQQFTTKTFVITSTPNYASVTLTSHFSDISGVLRLYETLWKASRSPDAEYQRWTKRLSFFAG